MTVGIQVDHCHEDSNIGPVDTDSDPDTDTPPAEEPAEKPPASTHDADTQTSPRNHDSPRPFLPSGHRATPQAHPQADIKPTSDPKIQSPSTSSTRRAYIGQTTVDSERTAGRRCRPRRSSHKSTKLDMSPATVTVDESQPVIAKSAPEARESSTAAPQVVTSLLAAVGLSPLASRQPAGPGRAPADAVWRAGMDTPRDPEDLLQSAPRPSPTTPPKTAWSTATSSARSRSTIPTAPATP